VESLFYKTLPYITAKGEISLFVQIKIKINHIKNKISLR